MMKPWVPLNVLVSRDVKGLYARALRGEIQHFTGVSDPYEEPLAPEVVIDSSIDTIAESVRCIVARLETAGFLAPATVHA